MALTTTHTAGWGILSGDSSIGSVSGIVTGVDFTNSQVAADEQNEIGRIIGHVVYDYAVTGRVSMMVSSAGLSTVRAMMGTGTSVSTTSLTLSDGTYNVSSVEIVESNTDFLKVNISVERWCMGNVATGVNALAGS